MRRKDREVTDLRKIEEILANARVLHLGLFDETFPYVVPLHYGYQLLDGKLSFFIHCAREGHKLDCLRKNSNVFVEIDCGEALIEAEQPCAFGAEYACVMCRGKAVIPEAAPEKRKALEALMKTQTGREYEISEKMTAAVCVIRIDVESCTAKARVR